MNQSQKLGRKYRKLVRESREHYLCVTSENDTFYLEITRKQAFRCLSAGMVASIRDADGACFIDKVDHEAVLDAMGSLS